MIVERRNRVGDASGVGKAARRTFGADMQNVSYSRATRRSVLAGLASSLTAATALQGCAATLARPEDINARPPAFAYITKRPEVTMAELIDRYENGHAAQGASGTERDFFRYSRNYVDHVIGATPGFDCLVEFLPNVDFPANAACGAQIDPNWARVVSGEVTEQVLHGPAWTYEAGPTPKRAYLIEATGVLPEALRAAATNLVPQLQSKSRRVSLYVLRQVQDTYACVDAVAPAQAILMVWPTDALPDQLNLETSALRIPTILDLTCYSSDVPFRG